MGGDVVDRRLVDALPQIVWTIDPAGRLEWINHRWTDLTGIELADTTTASALAAIHDDDRPQVEARWQTALATGEACEIEYRLRTRDGSYRWHLGRMAPMCDALGAVERFVGVAFDMQDRRDAEERAQAVTRDAARRKDELLALLSHELRNPLAPIITAAQLMELRGDPGTALEREVILRHARHLVRLVDDLLDVARVARGTITLASRPLDLMVVISLAVEANTPIYEQRQHRLTLEIAPGGLPVIGDEVRLVQVVSNLLSNAARYTPPGGHVQVSAERDGREVVVRVRDDGIGIDGALLPNVFELFIQGERGPDRALGGLGLGLSLVRMFTELHGGRVRAASEGHGRGSEFELRLPLSASIETGKPIATVMPRLTTRLSPRRILVVDDNPDAGLMVSRVLEGLGHRVRVASDAAEALAAALAFEPEIAILDIGLPVMDGYTLGRELRTRLARPPYLIALSGYGLAQDRRRSEEAGFTSHLVKPLEVSALLAALDELAALEAS